ncbi:MAG: alpha-L-fucosidase [Erysipelotrichaceae bacterium]
MSDKIIEGVHQTSEVEGYTKPMEQDVVANLEKFQDLKLGFMTHFGMFSQMSIMESWPVVDDKMDGRWSQKDVDWFDDENIKEFKKQYWNLNKSFNPIRFEPERYATTVASLGFKYTIIPTKHHDGFCMWDTKETDYKVTNSDCPFHVNKNADIYGTLIKEFEKQGLMCGAYFSKPDWHSNYYWSDEFRYGTNAIRNVSYDIRNEPERWEKFKEYTELQMQEVISKYAKVDILWLDGGQVAISNNQDIEMDKIAANLRKTNPGLIIVDRATGTKNENYLTPEGKVFEKYVPAPWESCIPVGKSFSFRYDDEWKSPFELARLFVDIICKGGNLALNIPTQPDGRLPKAAIENVSIFTDWVKEHEYAIFGSQPIAPYTCENAGVVKAKNGKKYMFHPGFDTINTGKFEYITLPIAFKWIKYKGEECNIEILGEHFVKLTLPARFHDQKTPLYFVFEYEDE